MDQGSIHFLNVEYFLRLLYDAIYAQHQLPSLTLFFVHLWIAITVLGYLITAGLLWVMVYSYMRMQQIYRIDSERYTTIEASHAHAEVEQSRWAHIKSLIESGQESDWRQAIIEADIMLDETLGRHGYMGNTVGEKLKMGNPAVFHTLQDAWGAHTVRNNVAHMGSAFELTDHVAYRTIQQYENVFHEFGEI